MLHNTIQSLYEELREITFNIIAFNRRYQCAINNGDIIKLYDFEENKLQKLINSARNLIKISKSQEIISQENKETLLKYTDVIQQIESYINANQLEIDNSKNS